MDRTKLEKLIKVEIQKYLNLPYFINTPQNPHQKLAAQVGKGTWQQIKKYSQKIAKTKNLNLSKLSPKALYNFQKKHQIGIDCSGLTFHLLNYLYQLKNQKSITKKLTGTKGKTGARRLSAHLLTSSPNSSPINNYHQIQIGDLIRTDSGRHVLFIINIKNNLVHYIHNSQKTQSRGVHTGTITIINPKKTLDQQIWSDKTLKNQPYSSLFKPQNGDGLFRLNCLH